ncbi:hypothetical protein [Dyella jiangningensis]|uniref:hypothetical protein n=1 Tax=Dyella jiangningensis TaxID=1379159 RepID=UPI0011BF3EED|nr:hypothetical protein [Dyella jiangningensis]
MAFILVALMMPMLLQLAGRMRGGDQLLQRSFDEQTALVGGAKIPASRLSVLHRWPNNAMRGRYGDLIQIDANWLCRSENGQYVVAIAQTMREPGEWARFSWRSASPRITWTWRTLSEAQVRNMLTGEQKVYRRLFGSDSSSQAKT